MFRQPIHKQNQAQADAEETPIEDIYRSIWVCCHRGTEDAPQIQSVLRTMGTSISLMIVRNSSYQIIHGEYVACRWAVALRWPVIPKR